MRRRARLRRTKPLGRRTPLRRSARLSGDAAAARPVSPASEAQRDKVAGLVCLVCGERPVDPAHLVPRSLGGCDHPDCVVPLCRVHHRRYDRGQLDLLPYLEPRFRAEVQYTGGRIGASPPARVPQARAVRFTQSRERLTALSTPRPGRAFNAG